MCVRARRRVVGMWSGVCVRHGICWRSLGLGRGSFWSRCEDQDFRVGIEFGLWGLKCGLGGDFEWWDRGVGVVLPTSNFRDGVYEYAADVRW